MRTKSITKFVHRNDEALRRHRCLQDENRKRPQKELSRSSRTEGGNPVRRIARVWKRVRGLGRGRW